MDMFKKMPVLKLGLPQPAVEVKWSRLLVVDSGSYADEDDDGQDDDKDGRRTRNGRLWMARIEDFTEFMPLFLTLDSMHDWRIFFGRADANEASLTFQWYFDGRRYGSDNPYFELLMRILRNACVSYNGNEGVESRSTSSSLQSIAGMIETCLDHLGVGGNVQLGTRPRFSRQPKGQIAWLHADLFTAIFSLGTMRDSIEDLAAKAKELVLATTARNERKDPVLDFELADADVRSFVNEVVDDPHNPLRSWFVFCSYAKTLGSSVIRPLRLITEVGERTATFPADADVFQPSLWKTLRSNGTKLPPCVSESTVLHEPDRDKVVNVFPLFSGAHHERELEDDIRLDENRIRRQRLRRCVEDVVGENVPHFVDRRTLPGDLELGVVDMDATNACGCVVI